jgi:hypothetical protein
MRNIFFRIFRRKASAKGLLKKLEKKVAELEHLVQSNILIDREDFHTFLEKIQPSSQEAQASIHVEHLQVDKIIIEKLDYSNNIGQLGIKELTGKLNIGTNTEGDFSKEIEKQLNEKLGTKVNIQAKKDNKS